jgi:hypothetical protein
MVTSFCSTGFTYCHRYRWCVWEHHDHCRHRTNVVTNDVTGQFLPGASCVGQLGPNLFDIVHLADLHVANAKGSGFAARQEQEVSSSYETPELTWGW